MEGRKCWLQRLTQESSNCAMNAFVTAAPVRAPGATHGRGGVCARPQRQPRPRARSPRATVAVPAGTVPMPECWGPGVVHDVLTPEDFDRLLEESSACDGVLVADFMAGWCRKCLVLVPKMRKLAAQFPNVWFCTINVNKVKRLPKQFAITQMPTFVFLKGGERVETLIGGASPPVVGEKLCAAVERLNEGSRCAARTE